MTAWTNAGILLLVTAVPTGAALGQGPSAAKIDAIFAEWARPNSPGCALGVIRDGRLVYKKGYGMANLDWDIPMTPSTVIYVGSVSKQFTAAAIVLLAREGKLSLDDDVRKYLPQLPSYEAPITIRHLIHHTSGVRDLYAVMNLAGLDVANVFPDDRALDLLARQRTLNFAPGNEFLYSNGGYFLLSEIVERASGKSFDEYAQDKMFQPLGMNDTHFHNDAGHIVKRRAMSYAPNGRGGFEQNYLSNFNKVGPGGLYTTVEDLLHWDSNYYENRVGGPGFTEQMLVRGVLNKGDTLDYAFALMHQKYQGVRVIDHSGGMMGFRADLLRFPEQRFSVACLCNLANINPSALTRRVADLYLAEEFRKTLNGYQGSYRNDDLDVTYAIAFRDGALFVERPGQSDERLDHTGDNTFRAYGFVTFTFERNASEVAQGFTVNAGRAKGVYFGRVGAASAARRTN